MIDYVDIDGVNKDSTRSKDDNGDNGDVNLMRLPNLLIHKDDDESSNDNVCSP